MVDGIDRTADVTPSLGPPLTIDFSAIGTVSSTAAITITYQVTGGPGTTGPAPDGGTIFLFRQFTIGGGGPGTGCNNSSTAEWGSFVTVNIGTLNVAVTPGTIDTCRTEMVTITVATANNDALTDNIVVTFTAGAADIYTPSLALFGGGFAGQTPVSSTVGRSPCSHLPTSSHCTAPGTIAFPLFRPCGGLGP